jgi:hypothetical protein
VGHAPDLLGALLAEMEQRALERVFRVLQILETSEEFATMFAALLTDRAAAWGGAREVIGHVLDGRFRDALLALTDSVPEAERLQAAAAAVPGPVADTTVRAWRLWTKTASPSEVFAPLAAALDAIRTDRSALLASLAAHYLPAPAADASTPMEGPRVAS